MVPGGFFMVFQGSELDFHGSRWFFMIFYGFRSGFHYSRWIFLIFMVPGWF